MSYKLSLGEMVEEIRMARFSLDLFLVLLVGTIAMFPTWPVHVGSRACVGTTHERQQEADEAISVFVWRYA